MTQTIEQVDGAYNWHTNARMPQDGGFTHATWSAYKKVKVHEKLRKAGLATGLKVRLLICGTEKGRWYTGEIEVFDFNMRFGTFLHLKQKNSTKVIDGWRVDKVEFL